MNETSESEDEKEIQENILIVQDEQLDIIEKLLIAQEMNNQEIQ